MTHPAGAGGMMSQGRRQFNAGAAGAGAPDADAVDPRPTPSQMKWLARGVDQPGGKLPLFDEVGRRVSERTVKSCVDRGWAEPWFNNPLKPEWQVCKLTEAGRRLVAGGA